MPLVASSGCAARYSSHLSAATRVWRLKRPADDVRVVKGAESDERLSARRRETAAKPAARAGKRPVAEVADAPADALAAAKKQKAPILSFGDEDDE